MVFYIYLDPPVFSVAAVGGRLGLQALAAVLRGFLQNCLLLDFDDYRWETGIRRALSTHAEVFDRSVIKKFLVQFRKRNRIVPVFQDDYSGKKDLAFIIDQAPAADLDFILAEEVVALPTGCATETATLATYQETDFEARREEAASNGREYSGGELDEEQFLEANFSKLVRHASRIEICDALCGRKFADNYEYTVKRLLGLLGVVLAEPERCELVLHCEKSPRDHHLISQLARHRPPRLAGMNISVCFYDPSAGRQCLPHERYLSTDQFGLEIGRGMDFLDSNTAKNRDVSLNLKDRGVIQSKLAAFQSFRLPAAKVP
jgi:hypothetical protein